MQNVCRKTFSGRRRRLQFRRGLVVLRNFPSSKTAVAFCESVKVVKTEEINFPSLSHIVKTQSADLEWRKILKNKKKTTKHFRTKFMQRHTQNAKAALELRNIEIFGNTLSDILFFDF